MQTWIYLAMIVLAGFAMGLMFKAPFVIACSIALAMTIAAVAIAAEWPAVSAFGAITAALFALQTAYVLGLTASSACQRKRCRK